MKRFLKKRWLGLPIGIITVVLLVFLLASGALAATGAFRVFRSDAEVTVLEPLEVTEIQAPGWFWDWHTPEIVEAVEQDIYAGMDLGVAGYSGKYFIHNISPQPVNITVTVTERSGQMDWYGLYIVYSNGWYGANICNYDTPVVTADADNFVHTFTFDIGSADYTAGEFPEVDSDQIKVFINGKVKDNADPDTALDFTLVVERGS